ncbi:MAG: MBL fold metallo-hydrolase [Candidatus Latescibacterota bacterium]
MNIVRLHISDVVTPDSHPLPNTVISNYVYLVSTASGVLLFDTGLGPPHDELDAIYRPTRYDLPRLLSQQGMSMRDVVVVVNCHLHFDHCGGNHLFPTLGSLSNAPNSRRLRRPVIGCASGLTSRVPAWMSSMASTTSGLRHASFRLPATRWTISRWFCSPPRPVILAGQAAKSAAGFDEGTGGWGPDRQELGATSIARLKAVSPTRVLFAHDECEWRVDAQGSQ